MSRLTNPQLVQLKNSLVEDLARQELVEILLALDIDGSRIWAPNWAWDQTLIETLRYLNRRGKMVAFIHLALDQAPNPKLSEFANTIGINVQTNFKEGPLSKAEIDELVRILENLPPFRSIASRITLIDTVFFGEAHGEEIKAQINLDGTPHDVALRLVQSLNEIDKNDPGHRLLYALIKEMLGHTGTNPASRFLNSLIPKIK